MSLAFAPVPPSSLEAEENVLSAMMLHERAIEAVCDTNLSADDFYRMSLGEVFKAILSLYAKGEPADAITVVAELKDNLEAAGGEDRIYELASLVPAASNAAHYARIVKDHAGRRRLIQMADEMSRAAYGGEGSAESLLADADAKMLKLQSGVKNSRERVFTGKQLVDEYRDLLESPIDEDAVGVRAPFSFLAPLMGSRLYVLSGFSGHGKTAGALQFLDSACEGGARVGLESIEMSRKDLAHRLVAARANVPYHEVRTGRVSSYHREAVERELAVVETWDFEVIDDQSADAAQIRRDQRNGKYDLLIIDHLHNIPVKDKRHERQELEQNAQQITGIAREFQIPVLLLAQLSREDKRNPFPRPTLSSLKGSGAIEQLASHVWFIWRQSDEFHNPTNDAEFIIAKNRYGGLGSKNLHFRASQVRFTEHAA